MEWLVRCLSRRRDDEEALFVTRGNQPRRLSYDAVKAGFGRFTKLARLRKKVTAHVLRHTVATTLLFNGCPIGHIKELLGTSSSIRPAGTTWASTSGRRRTRIRPS
jgi:integrase/recombinase XerD